MSNAECYVVRHPDGLEPFATHKQASSYAKTVGQDVSRIIQSQKEMAEIVSMPMMVAAYNNFVEGQGKNKVLRFSDKDVAAKRTWEVMCKHVTTKKGASMPTEEQSKEIEKRIVAKAESLVGGEIKRRRVDRDSTIVKLVAENPRRVGTAGHKSWEVLQEGMTVEQFVAAGGRINDLLWDVDKNRLKLVEPTTTKEESK